MISLPTFRGVLSGFNPLSLSPALWLNDTGSNPSTWTDMSGNGRDAVQGNVGNRPAIITNALNGKQVRRFDGVDDYLITATASDWTFLHYSTSSTFIVFRAGNVADPETIYTLCGTSASVVAPGGAYYAHDTRSSIPRNDALLHVIGTGGPNTVNARQNVVAGNTWAIMSVIGNPATTTFADRSKIWSNGSGPTASNTDFNPVSSDPPRHALAIGSAQNSSYTFISFLTGDIAEILIFPTALSDANRQRVERYLGTKYNIPVGYDPDAADYFNRITTAGSSITTANKNAVNAFITGCKADGIWPAIKASCLLAGPDNLAGALVPLVGTAPTNIGPFVDGDYSRTTGLIGDGVSKRLDSNYNNNADAQNDRHMSFWATAINSGGERAYIGGAITTGGSRLRLATGTNDITLFISSATGQTINSHAIGFTGATRTGASTTSYRNNGVTTAGTTTSDAPANETQTVIGITGNATQCNGRLSYYSFGQSLDLALLDARLTTYMASLT